MGTTPIRNDNAYFGRAKQSVQGTAVAPTNFIRWLDGSKIDWAVSTKEIWEGDGTRRLSQVIKDKQEVKLTEVFNPRPIELGFTEAAAMGASSDTVTPATVATTLSANTLANATSITVASNTGLTGSGTIVLIIEPGTATEEIAIFDTPATGAGPYTLTVDSTYNGGALKLAHTSAGAVRAVTLHTLTDQVDGSYYTLEVGIGSLSGAAGLTMRVRDCKVDSIKRSSKAGELLTYEVTWAGIAVSVQASPATVSYENHSPFFYTSSSGGWTINGSTTGDALAIESFDIEQKNNVNGPQTESIVLAALIFGKINVGVNFTFVMQNAQLILLTTTGSTTGTADAQAIGGGSMELKFTQADSFHTVDYKMNTLNYTKVPVPEPKNDGKYFSVSAAATSTSNQGQNTYVLQTIAGNAQTATY
jgi:hypothetical protein